MITQIAGIDVHIEGPEGADPIVMVHGWPDTYRLWDKQVEFLKAKYRCIRFSLPGYEAPQERRIYTVDEVTTLIRQVVEQLSPGKKVTLMVHDWGCIFGYEFYMRNQALVSRLIGVDIGEVRSARFDLTGKQKFYILAYQVWLAIAWKIGGGLGEWMTHKMARWVRSKSDPRFIASRMNYPYFLAWFGGAQSLRRQTQKLEPACPMLFIYGERKLFMFHSKRWLEKLNATPGSKAVGFATGHWVMLQAPDRFNEVTGEWLAATPA